MHIYTVLHETLYTYFPCAGAMDIKILPACYLTLCVINMHIQTTIILYCHGHIQDGHCSCDYKINIILNVSFNHVTLVHILFLTKQ